ncbi:peroxisome assembly protein 26 [Apus apus]|uniref:peroxisome assembly protein 26 n=1 Tax=Apus apus TaxID=8895 RepID=UPI0021F88148|nr:peroxisome assembly protein 26 [Apus apus]
MAAGAALRLPEGAGHLSRPSGAACPSGAELSFGGAAALEPEPEPEPGPGPGGRRAAGGGESAGSPPSSPPAAAMASEPPAWSPASAQAASLLEEAADLLVLHRDFAAAVERCEAGCDSLGPGPGAESSAEVKCSLCVVGIQALAEMNRWREVLSWVLQYYHVPEHLPPKVLELCILLYSKVREPQVMLEVGSSWLRDQANKNLLEYGSLLELYLLHVLLPLGQFEGAEELVRGCDVLDSEQQLAFLGTIRESRCQQTQGEEMHSTDEEQQDAATESVLGALSQKLLAMLTLLRRALRSMSSHFYLLPYKKMLLATFLLYLVVVRLDPASPTSLPFIYKLVQLFRQAWAAVFSPIHRPPIQD